MKIKTTKTKAEIISEIESLYEEYTSRTPSRYLKAGFMDRDTKGEALEELIDRLNS